MGNPHPNSFKKSPRDSGQMIPEAEDPFEALDLKNIPNNEIYTFRKSYEESSGGQSNRTSSEQALRICMENPNSTSDLCKSIDRQALILRQEYHVAMMRGIANISEEAAEVPMDSNDF
jgi:hypothetical protein